MITLIAWGISCFSGVNASMMFYTLTFFADVMVFSIVSDYVNKEDL